MAAGSGQFFPLFPFVIFSFVCKIKPKNEEVPRTNKTTELQTNKHVS